MFLDSKIVGAFDAELIKGWLGNKYSEALLAYRGTESRGFNFNALNEKINEQGPILFIIKSEYNLVFGGFISRYKG
jgi:hypothetical protein